MSILTFRHAPFEHLGWIADALVAHGLGCEYADLYQAPDAAPPAAEADALILMGGPMSANDDLPYIRKELEYIREAVLREKPVLGVCLGSQLIAKALGAKVYRNPTKEIGWYPVYFTQAAQRDPLFAGLGERETVFHWHGETFDLPRGAKRLAGSDACPNQAFRVGETVYGLQFHLEVTPQMIADWSTEDANSADMRELTQPIDPHAHAPRMSELARLVFGRWCTLVKRNIARCAG